jgi:hypothetical protein
MVACYWSNDIQVHIILACKISIVAFEEYPVQIIGPRTKDWQFEIRGQSNKIAKLPSLSTSNFSRSQFKILEVIVNIIDN